MHIALPNHPDTISFTYVLTDVYIHISIIAFRMGFYVVKVVAEVGGLEAQEG